MAYEEGEQECDAYEHALASGGQWSKSVEEMLYALICECLLFFCGEETSTASTAGKRWEKMEKGRYLIYRSTYVHIFWSLYLLSIGTLTRS